ncbi:MAG: hypothetical protein ACOZQL_23730 [Myxococcota bacterium]
MSFSTVPWPERILFGALCVATAAAPMLAHATLHSLPDAPPGRWYDSGVYVSWAFLIYFSWTCLPDLELPPKRRLAAWAAFLALEFAYPAVSWLLEGADRRYLFADIASYFSTCLAVAASVLLFDRGLRLVRGGDAGIVLVLLIISYFLVWPGLVVEWDWWALVELPQGDEVSQLLRGLGVVAGTVGVLRNLRRSSLYA